MGSNPIARSNTQLSQSFDDRGLERFRVGGNPFAAAFAVRIADNCGMLVFIDESGDPGFKIAKGSSPTFVVALVVFEQIAQSLAAQTAIENIAAEQKISGEFKFSQSRPATGQSR